MAIGKLSGVGLGLRPLHYDHVLDQRPAVPFFEIISENIMGVRGGSGGRALEKTLEIRSHYPMAMHGVSLNIGSVDPLDQDYLKKLKDLTHTIQPDLVSDHLCWTGVKGENLHDLLPLPYTEETLNHLATRVHAVQDFLGRPLVLENVSSYLSFTHNEMEEWTFIAELVRRTNCGVLLDVNNIYVSATNHSFDPIAYLDGIPLNSVRQMHLAGYSEENGFLIDTHDHPVTDPVWKLYQEAVRRFPEVPAIIEWDENIPPFERLQAEAKTAERVRSKALELEHALAD